MVRSEAKARLRWTAVGLCGLGWAVWVAHTRPFTWSADVATAVPIVAVALYAIVTEMQAVQSACKPAKGGGPARGRSPVRDGAPRSRDGQGWAWPIAALVVVSFELVNYMQGPRSSHPTLSSILDGFDSVSWEKGVTFLGWLALGMYLARR